MKLYPSNIFEAMGLSKMDDYIKLEDCKERFLYKIFSRNLSYGVYDGNSGFIGIRNKFGMDYLFTEYHWDTGPPFGTVHPKEEICEVPKNIQCKEYDGWKRDNIELFDWLMAKVKEISDERQG